MLVSNADARAASRAVRGGTAGGASASRVAADVCGTGASRLTIGCNNTDDVSCASNLRASVVDGRQVRRAVTGVRNRDSVIGYGQRRNRGGTAIIDSYRRAASVAVTGIARYSRAAGSVATDISTAAGSALTVGAG